MGLYVGESHFVDSRYNAARVEDEVDLETSSGRATLSLDLADAFANEEQLFACVAGKTAGVEEMLYTPVATLERP